MGFGERSQVVGINIKYIDRKISGTQCSSLPSSSVHGLSQARILECVAIFSSKGSS